LRPAYCDLHLLQDQQKKRGSSALFFCPTDSLLYARKKISTGQRATLKPGKSMKKADLNQTGF
jgi:hypothetical protein